MKPQKFISFLLLLVFAFSATPKKLLHDLFADHTDSYAFSASGLVVSKDGFNCDTQDEVVSTPFLSISPSSQLLSPEFLPLIKEAPLSSFILQNLSSAKDSRGPPSAC